jgi:signal transduction histidine kinase
MSRLGIRRRLLIVVVAAVAVALAVMVAGFNILLARNLSGDANDLVRSRALSVVALLEPVNGRLVVGEAPDDATADAQIWIFSGRRLVESPRAGSKVSAAARSLATGPSRYAEVPSADTRLYAVPVVDRGRRLGTVVAGVSLAPYEETRRSALIASLAFGALVLLIVAIAARWLLSSSLQPVARMTRQASLWSERDLDQRFGPGEARDELTELAATLDGLLDRLAASLRREQAFSAELSHELRTLLARVLAESELALRRERTPEDYRAALEVVQRNAQQLSRTVDALVAAARHEMAGARGTSDAYAVAAEAAEACSGLAAERELAIELERPARPIRLGVDAELAERILQPIVENACRYGRNNVRVSIERGPTAVVYAVDDDGPGVAEAERERIFEPGARGNGGGAAGLGLALARRLARSASGEVEAVSGTQGGRFVVRLPAG